LIPAGATAAGAGIGVIIGMLGGPIGAGIGALIGLAVGLVTDLVILIVQNWEEITAWCSDACATIGQFFTDLWDGIVAVWNNAPTWFYTNVTQPVVKFFSDLWTGTKELAISVWEGIKSGYSAIANWINVNIVQPVSGFFSNLWSGFKNGAVKAWEGVKSVFSKAGSFFSDVFSKAWRGIIKVFSIGGEIFVKIKDAITSAFKFVVNGIIKGLNSVISVPFKGINSVLKKIKNFEVAGAKPFDGIKTVSIPEIPLLKDGGMVNQGQMFIAREAGPEMVGSIGNRTAVVNNDQIVESVSRGVYQAVVSAMSQSGGTQVVEAKVNDKVLFEVVVNRNRQETMRTGYSPLLGGV
jgi:phage-related minor tail protein